MAEEKTQLLLRQISAFEEKVEICEKKIALKRLAEKLMVLKARPSAQRYVTINSIQKLREIIRDESIFENSQRYKPYVEDKDVIAYFKWFLDLLQYLRVLKNNFDSRIHRNLVQFFYTDSDQSPVSSNKARSGFPSRDVPYGIESYGNHVHEIRGLIKDKYEEVGAVQADKNIADIAERLLKKSQRIENLLREDINLANILVPDFTLFPRRSYTAGPRSDVDLAVLVRLVTVILTCFKRAAQLSREWLKWDSRRSANLQNSFQILKDLNRNILNRIGVVNNAIKLHERDYAENDDKLRRLMMRKERCTDLRYNLYESEERLKNIRLGLQKYKYEKYKILQQLKKAKRGSEYQKYLHTQFTKNNNLIQTMVMKVKLETYKLSILQQDLQIEQELKPSMIHLTNNVQDKCESLESLIEKGKQEGAKLEEILFSIKSDRQTVEGEMLKQTMLRNRRESIMLTDFPNADSILHHIP